MCLDFIRKTIRIRHPRIKVKRILEKLAKKGMVWIHGGRRCRGYGITRKGINILLKYGLA